MIAQITLSLMLFFCVINCNEQNKNVEIFNQVWNNVNEHFYDSNFNGVNWIEVKKEYKPQIENCKNNEALFSTLNKMLFELNSSHCGVGLLSELKSEISPYLFKKGEVGLDVRIIENKVVITTIIENSSADKANMKVGHTIQKINNLSIEEIEKRVKYKPPFNNVNKKFHFTTEILRHIYGKPGTNLIIETLDEKGNPSSIILTRTKRINGISFGEGLPIAFIKSNSFYISKDLAYLSFNAFQPSSLDQVLTNLKKVYESKGLIIDLRGNDGGSIEGMKNLLGRFVLKRIKYGSYINRNESNEDFIEPVASKYKGEVVVLVDEMSVSGAENMAGIFQRLNIGKVIGTQTPGQMLWGNGYLINNNITLVVPIYKMEYLNGFNPENNGITPDFEIELNREELLNSQDSQLNFAINYLNNLIKMNQ